MEKFRKFVMLYVETLHHILIVIVTKLFICFIDNLHDLSIYPLENQHVVCMSSTQRNTL